MIDNEIIGLLKEWGKFSEVHQVIGSGIFYCWRNSLRYRVEIADTGNPSDVLRYSIYVFNRNGTQNDRARGNGGDTIALAIQVVHWNNLEMDENSKKSD